MRIRLLLCLECKHTTFYQTNMNKLQCANCHAIHSELELMPVDEDDEEQ